MLFFIFRSFLLILFFSTSCILSMDTLDKSSLKNNVLDFFVTELNDAYLTEAQEKAQKIFDQLNILPIELKEQFQILYLKALGKFINLGKSPFCKEDEREHLNFVIKNNLVPSIEDPDNWDKILKESKSWIYWASKFELVNHEANKIENMDMELIGMSYAFLSLSELLSSGNNLDAPTMPWTSLLPSKFQEYIQSVKFYF